MMRLFQIMLIPKAERLPFYGGSGESDDLRYEYERYRCSEGFYDGQKLENIPEICRENHLGSIGFYVYGQAFCKFHHSERSFAFGWMYFVSVY